MSKNGPEYTEASVQTLAQQLTDDFIQSNQLALPHMLAAATSHDVATFQQRRYCEVVARTLNDPYSSIDLGNSKTIGDIHDIVIDGTFNGTPLIPATADSSESSAKVYVSSSYQFRQVVLGAYMRSPETAEAIVAHQIVGLHGSGSASLLSTLDNGLLPLGTLREERIIIPNGAKDNIEPWIANSSIRFVPFTYSHARQVREFWGKEINSMTLQKAIGAVIAEREDLIALNPGDSENAVKYREIKNKELGQQLLELHALADFISSKPDGDNDILAQRLIGDNFPVVHALSNTSLRQDDLMRISSSVGGEFAVKRPVGVSELPLIFVPRQKIREVEDIIKEKGLPTEVFAIEDVPSLDAVKPVDPRKVENATSNPISETEPVSIIRRFLRRHP